ncbi:MAG TPA: hypothetical protein DCE06_00970, partial [Thermotoga naphthophila]|nr:hypothetical protein [Thermotoga petrophila]
PTTGIYTLSLHDTLQILVERPPVCPFLPRCPRRVDRCLAELPELIEIEENHFVRCFNPVEEEVSVEGNT